MDSSYTDIVLELYRDPPNYGELQGHNLRTCGGNPTCGDQACMQAIIKDGKISDIKFTANGCAISKASCAMLTEMVKGKKIEEVLAFEGKDVFESIGGIIQTRIKCALLGLVVFKRGLEAFEKNNREKTVVEGIKI
ncbi:MAG: iron-sulfur cluster assembly scaffold protein [Patescibacteria group bacterium]